MDECENYMIKPEQLGKYRVLLINENGIYASRHNKVYFLNKTANKIQSIYRYTPSILNRMCSFSRLISRLLRLNYYDLILTQAGTLVGVVPNAIIRAEAKSTIFEVTFSITRGRCPLSIASTPNKRIYFGEYFNNPNREEIYIYCSEDDGKSWHVCYIFPSGTIRHVHRILYDPYRKGILVLTGDNNGECKIIFTSDDFKTVDKLAAGGQEFRAVSVIPLPEGIIIPSDSPISKNYIQLLDNQGNIHKLCEIPGSSFYSCKTDSCMFISTGVEPSKINLSKNVSLWASINGVDWKNVFTAEKDCWSLTLFQYSNLILPQYNDKNNYLYSSAIGVKKHDGYMLRWKVTDIIDVL